MSIKNLNHKYYQEHVLQYILLIITFTFFLYLLFLLTNYVFKVVVVSFLSMLYFGWGMWHHWEEKNLNRKHFFEYLVISALIFMILSFVFLV